MAIAFRQINKGDFNVSAGSIAVTFSSAVAAGSIIIAAGEFTNNAGLTITLADGSGDTVTDSGSGLVINTGAGNVSYVKAFFAPTAGVTTVTGTFSGGTNPTFGSLFIWEISGYIAAAFDQVVFNNSTSATTSPSSGATGTLAGAEAAIAYCATNTNVTLAGSGWTFGQGSIVGSNTGDGLTAHTADGGEHQITASTAAITGTFTQANGICTTWVAAIKETGSVGPVLTLMPQILAG